jgi:16S rRNA (guanine527-N7)-methyltransferase
VIPSFDQFRDPGSGLDPTAVERLETYLALILKWNARINLTSVRDPDEIVQRHFVECIFAAAQFPANVKTLLDFGSGAGLPGIPIAICRPEIAVTLAESQGKKAAFLREAIRTLGLTAEVWDRRVEQMPPPRVFDAVTLRAVDKMAEACAAAVPRLAPGGILMVFATPKTEAALEDLSGVEWQGDLPVPGSDHGFLKIGSRN